MGVDWFDSDFDDLKSHFDRNCGVKEYTPHTAKVHSVGWNCDGRRLASGAFDKTVVVLNLDREKLSIDHTFRGHTASVDQLCWSKTHPDLLATASPDKTARVWDARTQKCVTTIDTPGENLNITWSFDGNSIAVGNKTDLITFIDARTYKKIAEQQFPFETNEISWNTRSDLFFLTNGLGCVVVLSYPDLQQLHTMKAHCTTCICIDVDPTGKYFAVGSADALVSIWDAENLACIRTLSNLDWAIRALSFSHDGKILTSGSEDMHIDISHVNTGEKLRSIPVESSTFTVAWHPNQYFMAYACENKDRKKDPGSLKLFGLPGSS